MTPSRASNKQNLAPWLSFGFSLSIRSNVAIASLFSSNVILTIASFFSEHRTMPMVCACGGTAGGFDQPEEPDADVPDAGEPDAGPDAKPPHVYPDAGPDAGTDAGEAGTDDANEGRG